MLSVILLILKIIGITLLVLIGLLLVILLTVLIVPIRYRVQAEHGEEKLHIVARTSWLLHLIGVNASYVDGVFRVRMRVLWITLYDNLKPNIKKRKKSKPGKKSHNKTSRSSSVSKSLVPSKRNNNIEKNAENNAVNNAVNNAEKNIENNAEDNAEKNNIENNKAQNNKAQNNKAQNNNPDNNNVVMKEQVIKHVKHDVITAKHELPLPSEYESSQQAKFSSEEKKKFLFEKIIDEIKEKTVKIIHKINMIKDRIVAFFAGIKQKIIKWFNSLQKIKHKISLILKFIKDEVNKDGFGVTFSALKKLLKHVLPTKLRSRIVFGTGDPCSTGQALGAIGFVYGLYGDKVKIIPDFENKKLEGKHDARGRIRLITVLIIVIKLILDKRFKQLKNNFQILKEAL